MSTIIDGSAGITFPNSTIQASAGSVIQVVNSTTFYTSGASTTSTSMVTTGASISITPKFSTSKIWLQINGNIYSDNGTGSPWFTIYRGATNLATGTSVSTFGGVYNAGGGIVVPANFVAYDSPATTSSTTYTLYFRTGSGTIYFGFPNGGAGSSAVILTAMEIAA